MKTILLTGAKGMLAYDFLNHFSNNFKIIPLDRDNGDITDISSIEKIIEDNEPELLLNFAAYTNVEDAEDIGVKDNFEVNALWVYNLAKISAKYDMDLITVSTDYVFDGTKKIWYSETDLPNPINSYGMAKYLWEKLAIQENPNTIIIRTSRLYGWWNEFIERHNAKGDVETIPRYKNFVNTMIKLAEIKKKVKVVNDQFWSPTYTVDLCKAIIEIIENIDMYRWKILHLCNNTTDNGISWFEFAEQIFKTIATKTQLHPCSSKEFITKAKRPEHTKLLNWSDVRLRDWKEGINEYIKMI